MFSKTEIDFMRSIGVNVDFSSLSDEELAEIEDIVSEKMQKSGFDKNYKITDTGKMCEEILDKL